MSAQQFPPGWDTERVERLLAHYEESSEEQQVAEDEDAMREQTGESSKCESEGHSPPSSPRR